MDNTVRKGGVAFKWLHLILGGRTRAPPDPPIYVGGLRPPTPAIGGLTCFKNPSAIYGGIEFQIVASEPTPRFSAEDPNTILERGSQHS